MKAKISCACLGILGLFFLLRITATIIIAHSGEKLPYTNGECRHITNGYGDGYHTGADYYSVDWNLPGTADNGKPVRNISWGTVSFRGWPWVCCPRAQRVRNKRRVRSARNNGLKIKSPPSVYWKVWSTRPSEGISS